MNIKISIIVPIYNGDKYLSRCLNSLLSQTLKDIEIILINDGSNDNSKCICEQFKQNNQNIKLINQENKGLGNARNTGIPYCNGEYVTFVDSDDYLNNKCLEILYELAKKYNSYLCFSNVKIVKKEIHKEIKNNINYKQLSKQEAFNIFFRANKEKDLHGVHGKLVKKELLNDFKFVENKINEDIPYTYEMIKKAKNIVFVDEELYYYFKNSNGISNKSFNIEKMDLLDIWDDIYKRVEKEFPENIQLCIQNCKRARYTLLSKMFIDGYDKNNLELNRIHYELKRYVRKNYFDLLKINMSLSRKLLLTFLII